MILEIRFFMSCMGQVGYISRDVSEIREKLSLPEQEFVKLQLKRANELNDPERVINREASDGREIKRNRVITRIMIPLTLFAGQVRVAPCDL
jgi:hypothetical protein